MFGFGKKKALLQEFLNDSSMAVLHIYSDGAITIDGKKLEEFETMRGADLETLVKLPAGTHTIHGKYSNDRFKTGAVDSEIPLEAGHEYRLALYLYSKAQTDAMGDRYVYFQSFTWGSKEVGLVCLILR